MFSQFFFIFCCVELKKLFHHKFQLVFPHTATKNEEAPLVCMQSRMGWNFSAKNIFAYPTKTHKNIP